MYMYIAMGRPREFDTAVLVKLTFEQKRGLDALASRMGIPRSAVLRLLLDKATATPYTKSASPRTHEVDAPEPVDGSGPPPPVASPARPSFPDAELDALLKEIG